MTEVIKNMYLKAKSELLPGITSSSFPCIIGVRQGENLSALLFSIYLADLKKMVEQCTGLRYVNEAQEKLLDREINCVIFIIFTDVCGLHCFISRITRWFKNISEQNARVLHTL